MSATPDALAFMRQHAPSLDRLCRPYSGLAAWTENGKANASIFGLDRTAETHHFSKDHKPEASFLDLIQEQVNAGADPKAILEFAKFCAANAHVKEVK